MSDTRLREVEARFHETGLVEDEAEWISERLRAGDLSDDQLQIAVYCDHPAALLVQEGKPDLDDVVAWVKSMPKISGNPLMALRVALLIGLQVHPCYKEHNPESDLGKDALVAAYNYLCDSSMKNAEASLNAGQMAQDDSDIHIATYGMDYYPEEPDRLLSSYAIQAIAASAHIAAQLPTLSDELRWILTDYPSQAAADASRALCISDTHVSRGNSDISMVELRFHGSVVRQAICDSLIPWALGYKDPLLDLVAELEATSTTD